MGRRKIEMKMVTDRSCRQVTFSKRRTGLFKKANELATLCAVQIVIVVFSPGGKPFSFGNPGVEPLVDRFTNHRDHQLPRDNSGRRSERLAEELNGIQKRIQVEKNRGDALEKALAAAADCLDFLIPRAIEEMGIEELVEMRRRLTNLREQLDGRAMEMEASSTLMLLSNRR
ncbi:unnamed protein product [Linum tenue]|uniref:MADS-box domain-containing protein n=1 Tax=Linum tenue TaxID=586396 RepID=A0AAV0PY73_9ROSI|nr:unnamed protein product [Linum tenue]